MFVATDMVTTRANSQTFTEPCGAGGQVAGLLTTGGQLPHVHLDYGTSRTTSVSSPESMS